MNTHALMTKFALMFTAVFFLSHTALSNTTPKNKKTNDEAEKTIRQYFKFPAILIPMHEIQKPDLPQKVEVLFSTGSNGKVNFVLVKTFQPELKKEIENQFLKLNLPQVKPETINSVVLNFKTL